MTAAQLQEKRGSRVPGWRRLIVAAWALPTVAGIGAATAASAAGLVAVGSIPIASVGAEVTDLELDFANQRLFALARNPGMIAVVDLPRASVVQLVQGLPAPRGLAHEPPNGQLYVATGDGNLAVLQGMPLHRAATLKIGRDLGSPYYDAGSTRVFLGHDHGAVSVIDTSHNIALPAIVLDGDPGPLAFEAQGTRMFAAAADDGRILVADRAASRQVASWNTGGFHGAAALALDETAGLIFAAFRQPAALAWFDLAGGGLKGQTEACAKPAELLLDGQRGLVYLICADGRMEVFQRGAAGGDGRIGSISTAEGATAASLSPTGDRLYLAVPAAGGRGAEIRIYAPSE